MTLKDRAYDLISVARLRARGVPRPRAAPDAQSEDGVLIGPANSAGQGYAWARALEGARARTLATSMQFTHESGVFNFPVDLAVPSGYGAHSRRWQRAQQRVLETYRGIMIESAQPVLGGLFGGDINRQLSRFQGTGARLGLMFHGSDLRDPDRHLDAEPDSYFAIDPAFASAMRIATRRSRALIASSELPVFVSTPDLLDEVVEATWVPVVVDPELWAHDTTPLTRPGPLRVVHAPSSAHIKGSDIIDPVLQSLNDEGLIQYQRIAGVDHARMPALYHAADVVIDQIRGGPYGVAACEAMAAGRLVLAYVPGGVRSAVKDLTGMELPVVDVLPHTLEDTLRAIASDRDAFVDTASRGPAYVRHVHDGRRSGATLAAWVDGRSPAAPGRM